jgi:thiamine kinase-like enzyme
MQLFSWMQKGSVTLQTRLLHYRDDAPNIPFLAGSLKAVAEAVDSWPGYAERYSQKLRVMADVILDRIVQTTLRDDSAFNVLTHCDLWTNNMLFRYCDVPNDLRFLDFQLAHFSSPAIDLNYFFNTSLCEEVRMNHRDRLMEVKLILIYEKHKIKSHL